MTDHRLTKTLAAALAAATFMGAAIAAAPALAQPRPYGGPGYNSNNGGAGRHYYNGQWVDQSRWDQGRQREFQRNSRYRNYGNRNNGGDALAAGIVGFALGAAILGSQNDSGRAYGYSQDSGHIATCRTRYRSYDAGSNSYLGNDGYRHYCM